MEKTEPYDWLEVKRRIRLSFAGDGFEFTGHARKEMADDDIIEADVEHVLRAGLMKMPAEFVKGQWRYRLETRKIEVVIAFEDKNSWVITAWRR